MKKLKLKKNDLVVVVRGKKQERGKTGKILKILTEKNRLVVEKIHMVKEYVRPNPQKNIKGGIVEKEGSIPMASVMYYCKECEQGIRIGYKNIGDKKQRICKKCETVID